MRRAFIAGLGAICLSSLAAAEPASVWTHNGSTVTLDATGDQRTFQYLEPRPGMIDAGATKGSVLFRGRVSGARYIGQATLYNPRCGPLDYAVSGRILNDGRRVVLTGSAPRVGRDCRITGRFQDRLEFNYAGKQDGTASAGASFPAAFRGRWKLVGGKTASCDAEAFEERTRVVTVGETAWTGWENGCDLKTVTLPRDDMPGRGPRFRAEQSCFAEASEYRSIETWQIETIAGEEVLLQTTVRTWDHRDDGKPVPAPADDVGAVDVYLRCR